jgi:hypothetical protein
MDTTSNPYPIRVLSFGAGVMFEGRAYLHPSRIPLDQVDIRSEEEKGQQTMFDMECEGMCGL